MARSDFHDRCSGWSDVDDVSTHPAELDAISDPEYRTGDDVEAAGEGADRPLERKGETGAYQTDDQSELSGERSPDNAGPDCGEHSHDVSGAFANVELAVTVLDPARPETPDDGSENQSRGDQGTGEDQLAGDGAVADVVEDGFHRVLNKYFQSGVEGDGRVLWLVVMMAVGVVVCREGVLVWAVSDETGL